MANKRNLKKQINFICGELFAEAVAASACAGRSDKEDNLHALLKRILCMHSDYIMRVSHPEPGMKAKKYYKAMVESMEKDVDDVIDQICNMLN